MSNNTNESLILIKELLLNIIDSFFVLFKKITNVSIIPIKVYLNYIIFIELSIGINNL